MISSDKEYFRWLKYFKDHKITKDTWSLLSEKEAATYIQKVKEVKDYYYSNKSRLKNKHRDIDPFCEEDWDN